MIMRRPYLVLARVLNDVISRDSSHKLWRECISCQSAITAEPDRMVYVSISV